MLDSFQVPLGYMSGVYTLDYTVRITGSNDLPVALADAVQVSAESPFIATGALLANDADVDALDVLSLASVETLSGNGNQWALVDGGIAAVEASGLRALRAGETMVDVLSYTVSDGHGGVASAEVSVTLVGVNDAPVAATDSLVLGEDDGQAAMTLTQLLANDTDIDTGDTLSVTGVDALSAQGVTVTLLNDTLVYDAGTRFNTLAAGQVLVDEVGYTVSDASGASASGMINVEILGANDAPILVAPLADQSVAGGTAVALTLPTGTFTDIDTGDALALSASLEGGAALPTWLTFDAATGSFTGTAPTTAQTLSLQVTATDTQGASVQDVFVLDVTASGNGNGGTHGNEGVGNGEDPPPPGHDGNQNDGPGTGPGNPGNVHGGLFVNLYPISLLSAWSATMAEVDFHLAGEGSEDEDGALTTPTWVIALPEATDGSRWSRTPSTV